MATREISYRQAVNEALAEEMERDPKVILIGQDLAGAPHSDNPEFQDAWGGAMGVTKGLIGRFGKNRVIDTPISETAIMGAATGAAATGLRPVAELMFVSFAGVCLDQIVNQAAKMRYMFGGGAQVPLTIRTTIGGGMNAGAQHSDLNYSMFAHYPGLKCVVPSNAADAKGLLKSAIRDNDPVVVFENKMLYDVKGPVPDGEYLVPIGKGKIVREGSDVTIIALSRMVDIALKAAASLEKQGINAEVLDPRSVAPLDEEFILESVRKTERLIVVDEDSPRCSVASDIIALVAEQALDCLDAPPRRVMPPNIPIPFAPSLEQAYLPQVKDVIAAVQSIMGVGV